MSFNKTMEQLQPYEVIAANIHCGNILNIDDQLVYVGHVERITYDTLEFHFNIINTQTPSFIKKSYKITDMLTILLNK